MNHEINPGKSARQIFDVALRSVDARRSVRNAVRLEGPRLIIHDTIINLDKPQSIYALAIGKAALPMAAGLDDVLKEKLTEGLVVGLDSQISDTSLSQSQQTLQTVWRLQQGGHPLPTRASLNAARSAFDLLYRANKERALVIFLISGGGSSMIEWPRHENITLEDLRDANRLLVSCGASITEINSVRRSFSAVKGGGLAAFAPRSFQVTLIVSDTPKGQESIVASGPTCDPPLDAPSAVGVIERYGLSATVPATILRAVRGTRDQGLKESDGELRKAYVILDCETALEAAKEEAHQRGFTVEVAIDISDQPIADGCQLMLSRLFELRSRVGISNRVVCLISGGEFSCPVRGNGIGGRNAETALRCSIELDEKRRLNKEGIDMPRVAVLSAGTDGIDGNSTAAGAVADEWTVERAGRLGMNALEFLGRSDGFNFFDALGDTIVSGPTGTNVRDLRITLAS